jgi:hypothetical protein
VSQKIYAKSWGLTTVRPQSVSPYCLWTYQHCWARGRNGTYGVGTERAIKIIVRKGVPKSAGSLCQYDRPIRRHRIELSSHLLSGYPIRGRHPHLYGLTTLQRGKLISLCHSTSFDAARQIMVIQRLASRTTVAGAPQKTAASDGTYGAGTAGPLACREEKR